MSNEKNADYRYTLNLDFKTPMEKEAYDKMMAYTKAKNITIKQFLLEQILGEEIYKKWLEVQGTKIVDYNSQINENVRIMAETMKLFQESCAEILDGIKLSLQGSQRNEESQNQQECEEPWTRGDFRKCNEKEFDQYGNYLGTQPIPEYMRGNGYSYESRPQENGNGFANGFVGGNNFKY